MTSPTHLVVDWPLLLEELRLTGLSFRDIATQVDVSHVALFQYSHGATSPHHANGERLIAYWSERTGKHRHELPMCESVRFAKVGA